MADDERMGGSPPLQIPLAILAAALFLMVGFQTWQLIRERDNLSELRGTQQPTMDQSLKLRQQLESLAGKTAQLAADGDQGARAIVDDLRRQGITVKPPGAN